jgi:hypothetical protein
MDTYNRYAHVIIGFNEKETTFSEGGEIIAIDVEVNDLKKLDVKYILINDLTGEKSELPVLNWDNGYAELIYDEFGIRIFKLFYY